MNVCDFLGDSIKRSSPHSARWSTRHQTTGTSTSTPSPLPTASTCKRQRASPFKLLYGVTATLPLELKDDGGQYSWATDDATAEAISHRAETIADFLQQKRKSAQENITAAQAKQKKRFDLKHAPLLLSLIHI